LPRSILLFVQGIAGLAAGPRSHSLLPDFNLTPPRATADKKQPHQAAFLFVIRYEYNF